MLIIVLAFCVSVFSASDAAASDPIDITLPCRYAVAIGIEKEYIPDFSLWASSAINSARNAKYGRLRSWRGGGAWTAGTPNKNQHIGVDLGYRHVVTAVMTQGRRGSNEYVTEYYLEFSSDNRTWNVYTNQYGTPKMFSGNTDDNSVHEVDLTYSLVARFIRIIPQRWHRSISMRIEFKGCRFDSAGATFDGHSRITYSIAAPGEHTQTRQDRLKLRFRTGQADGLLFFADGNQGDYIVLELLQGKLHFHIDLGSTASLSGATSMEAGSLLDDNQWHDVDIRRDERTINFTVDQLKITNLTNGDFLALDLDRYIHLGGVDTFLHPGKLMKSRRNFRGCLENVWFNYMDMIKDTRMKLPRFQVHGAVVLGMCDAEPVIPFTFATFSSHLKLKRPPGTRLRVAFYFRSYSQGGLLFVHHMSEKARIMMKINDDGHIEYLVQTINDPEVFSIMKNRDVSALGAQTDVFTDGLWHSVIVDVESGSTGRVGSINFTVDGLSDASNRQLDFTLGTEYLFGGGYLEGGEVGFLGCMKYLSISNEPVLSFTREENYGVINGTCIIQDRCDPNPCEHGGICTQNDNRFQCQCDKTGYEGAVCHKSKYVVSCEEARMLNPIVSERTMKIDIDDAGPLEPFEARCYFDHEKETAITEIKHDSMKPMFVNGYQQPGSYVRPITYDAGREQFDELVARARSCEQAISYRCFSSKLLSSPGGTDPNQPSWGWWVGRTNQNMRYWGGSSPGSGRCSCALKGECKKDFQCNCDAGLAENDIYDSGMLTHKEHLPVMELRFGDTGTLEDKRWGQHTLGPLKCSGDSLFDNIVTFRKRDASIPLPTFEARTSGDIRFQFKTTALNGIFLQNTGQYHFIEVKLVFGNSIHFRFDVGNGIQTLEKTTAYPLNDDVWHTVHVERNRRLAMLRVDQQAEVTIEEPANQGFRTLELESALMIGSSVDYTDGYVGCMRALMVNGVMIDLRGMVDSRKVTYGVSAGCNPKCAKNPCMNNGICIEWYSHYTCDCAYTPYRGWDCGREMGVNMEPGYMVSYGFDQETGSIATDEEHIIIGFSTQEKKGILMLIINDNPSKPEYISIEMNNNGGVRVALDVGFQRVEANLDLQNVDLANGQQHVVNVTRTNKGRTLIITVDDYPPKIEVFAGISDSSDTKLDNPKYIYFGRNRTTRPGDGFKGCLFRAQFDNVFPLKRVFQDPRPSYVYLEPEGLIHEDMCAFEEVTNAPEPAEFRPTPPLTNVSWPGAGARQDDAPVSWADGWVIALILLAAMFVVAAILNFVWRCFLREKRAYRTYEAKDAQYYDNPDFAVAAASTRQPEVQKRREWYI